MKKFFRVIIFLLVLSGTGYLFYNSILILNNNEAAVIYSHIFGRINKVYSHYRNFVPAKSIPGTYDIKKFFVKNSFRIKYKNFISFLDKNFDIIRLDIVVSYDLNKNMLVSIAKKFENDNQIRKSIKYNIEDFLDKKIFDVINKKKDFRNFISNCRNDILTNLKKNFINTGINIDNIDVIVKNIPLIVDMGKYRKLAVKSLEYEREYKFKLRSIELEKLKLRQEALNKVEYLKIIGDYIKENPLILNYLLIEKINNVNTIVLPMNTSGLLFKDTLNSEILKNLMKQDAKK